MLLMFLLATAGAMHLKGLKPCVSCSGTQRRGSPLRMYGKESHLVDRCYVIQQSRREAAAEQSAKWVSEDAHQEVLQEGALEPGAEIDAACEVGCLLQEGGLAARQHARIDYHLAPLQRHATGRCHMCHALPRLHIVGFRGCWAIQQVCSMLDPASTCLGETY